MVGPPIIAPLSLLRISEIDGDINCCFKLRLSHLILEYSKFHWGFWINPRIYQCF